MSLSALLQNILCDQDEQNQKELEQNAWEMFCSILLHSEIGDAWMTIARPERFDSTDDSSEIYQKSVALIQRCAQAAAHCAKYASVRELLLAYQQIEVNASLHNHSDVSFPIMIHSAALLQQLSIAPKVTPKLSEMLCEISNSYFHHVQRVFMEQSPSIVLPGTSPIASVALQCCTAIACIATQIGSIVSIQRPNSHEQSHEGMAAINQKNTATVVKDGKAIATVHHFWRRVASEMPAEADSPSSTDIVDNPIAALCYSILKSVANCLAFLQTAESKRISPTASIERQFPMWFPLSTLSSFETTFGSDGEKLSFQHLNSEAHRFNCSDGTVAGIIRLLTPADISRKRGM